MSERSKGDTSSSLAAAPALLSSGKIVKNPLLSASVTGLTFDDFTNKPLLLPAAPPIVHPTPVVSRESTPLVTVGKSSDIDTENLSEINLNDTSGTSSSNIADTSDENSNSLIESTNQVDNSILSQAASSFSQLPSVASSVFSTFSKKFNSSTGRDDFNANHPQLDIQPFATPFVGQGAQTQAQVVPPPRAFESQNFQQQPQQQIGLPPPPQSQPVEPPTFYSPTEIPSAPSGLSGPAPASGQNTYRLPAKKKQYAQIPGLSSTHQESVQPPQQAVAPGFFPPIGFESSPKAPVISEYSNYDKPTPAKGGLFSLSNLGVPNVLQNLSGLVQSATGVSQRPQEEHPNTFGSSEPYYQPQANQNNFSAPASGTTAVNFLGPQTGSFSSKQVPLIPTAGGPQQAPTSTGVLSQFQPPKPKTPETVHPTLFQPQTAPSRPPSEGAPTNTGVYFEGAQPSKPKTPEAVQPSLAQQPTFFQPPTAPSRPPSEGAPPTTGVLFPGVLPPKPKTPEAVQPSLAQQPTFFQPPTAPSRPPSEGAPSTTGVLFPGAQPPKTKTPEATQPILFAPSSRPPSVGQPQFPGQPPTSLTPGISEKVQPANLFPPPPTAGTNLSGSSTFPNFFGPPKSHTPESKQTSANEISSGSPANFFAPPQSVNNNYSLGPPPPKSSTPESHLASGRPPPTTGNYFSVQPIQSPIPAFSSQPAVTPPIPSGFAQPSAAQLPPQVKPPSTGPAPSTSFRLQKGTRLYKSPFAASQTQPQLPQVYENISSPPAQEAINFFNPQLAFQNSQPQVIPPQIPTLATAPPPAVNFFNPQGSGSVKEVPAPPANILEPTLVSAPAAISATPTAAFNFFNPQSQVAFEPIKQSSAVPTPIQAVSDPQETPDTVKDSKATSDNISEKPQDQSPATDSTQTTAITDQTSEQSSTINRSEAKQELSTQLQEQQNNILPPPPAINFGTSTSSKETANFPPPPPQHSFVNKPSSNPYRKGLQSGHSQLPPAPSLSSFFTPIDQGNNFFQPSINSSVPIAAQQSAVNFFADTSSVVPPTTQIPDLVKVPGQEENSIPAEAQQPIASFFTNSEYSPVSQVSNLVTASEEAPKVLEENSVETTILQSIIEPSSDSSAAPEEEKAEQESVKALTPVPSNSAVDNPLSFYKPDTQEPPAPNELSKVATKPEENSKIASPQIPQDTPVPEPVPNSFARVFDQPAAPPIPAQQRPSLPDPTTFFDSFSLVPSLGQVTAPPAPASAPSEDPNSQRIQNFFNNPPPKELDTVGDLNYNLVGSGLSVQNLQIRSLTPASNLAEPPSSSCSEFSELNSSLSVSAANRQPLIQAADSSKVSPEEESIFESPEYQDLPDEIVNELKMANSLLGNSAPANNETYRPAVKHWFYNRKLDAKCLWTPFSFHDSALLEAAFLKGDEGPTLVAVEGGRFDVNISERTKIPVYWEGEPTEVKRCSWFYKANDSKYIPYEEETADLLEEEYKKAFESCEWHKKIPILAGDTVVFHGPTVIVHFTPQIQVDAWGGSSQTITRPRVVKRDLDDFNIDQGEAHKVDHLLFMVHGIGSACDLKMRSVEEVVDEFRSIALQLVQSHYKNSVESGNVGRVEVLPVSWHSELHCDELGIDEKLKSITLESIPKLRNFTNDTLLDILFYTSPMFCQRIINTVTASMNNIYLKYQQRNPQFQGGVSLAGHSLGSLIMFDLLCHQRPRRDSDQKNMDGPVESSKLNEDTGQNITYKMGQAGTGQPFISYPQLLFQPRMFFALGSPIGMFVTIRGIDKLGLDFRLPTCPGFYNIFHPYDPVAYRLEALVNPDMNGIAPVLIPHHKGRKRMHLELKETMTRVGADLKQRFYETFKTTLDSVNFLTPKHKNDHKELEKEVDKKLLELQANQEQQNVASTSRSRANSNSTNQSDTEIMEIDFPLGKLNDSKRIDYVLQEAPLEFFNEYLFALSSHVCYWESEDTILFVMKQIYNDSGVSPDSQVPQQSMTIERPSSGTSTAQQSPTTTS